MLIALHYKWRGTSVTNLKPGPSFPSSHCTALLLSKHRNLYSQRSNFTLRLGHFVRSWQDRGLTCYLLTIWMKRNSTVCRKVSMTLLQSDTESTVWTRLMLVILSRENVKLSYSGIMWFHKWGIHLACNGFWLSISMFVVILHSERNGNVQRVVREYKCCSFCWWQIKF